MLLAITFAQIIKLKPLLLHFLLKSSCCTRLFGVGPKTLLEVSAEVHNRNLEIGSPHSIKSRKVVRKVMHPLSFPNNFQKRGSWVRRDIKLHKLHTMNKLGFYLHNKIISKITISLGSSFLFSFLNVGYAKKKN